MCCLFNRLVNSHKLLLVSKNQQKMVNKLARIKLACKRHVQF